MRLTKEKKDEIELRSKRIKYTKEKTNKQNDNKNRIINTFDFIFQRN